MAITQIDPYYRVGTATFAASTAVTGQGTSWLGNVEPGDQIYNRLGQMAVVASVNSDTSITLVTAFAGTVQTAQAYTIYRVPDSVRLENFSQRSVNLLQGGNVMAEAQIDGTGGDWLSYFIGSGAKARTKFTQQARDLLDDTTFTAMRQTLGAHDAANLITGLIANARLPDRLTNGSIPSSNYNLALANGFYNGGGAGAVNPPPGSASFGWLLVTGLNGFRLTQMAGYGDEIYYRWSQDGGATWTAWDLMVPVYRSNANGSYARYPGRFQECWHTISVTDPSKTAFGSIYLGEQPTWTFPAAFASPPIFMAQVKASGDRKWITGGGSDATATQAAFQTVSGVATTDSSGAVGLRAIGVY